MVAARVGFRCSRPECGAATSGPTKLPAEDSNVGVAAHITAAAPGGPRFDVGLTGDQRRAPENAVWVCQTCAKMIDDDVSTFTPSVLSRWKADAESHARAELGKTRPRKATRPRRSVAAQLKRDLALKERMQRVILKKADPWGGGPPPRGANLAKGRVIVRRVGDRLYPEIDDGIPSNWLRLEVWGFYHNGLEVILNLRPGIIAASTFPVGRKWRIIEHGEDVDRSQFGEAKIWVLGRIPFRNIEQFDPDGDEYYREPHLYCWYADGGAPWEAVAYRLCDDGGYDWPLEVANQLPDPSREPV